MIDLDMDGAYAKVTLSRPPVNAISDDWIERLHDILTQVDAAEDISVIWFRSDRKVFSAGADLDLMRSRFDTKEGRLEMISFVRKLQAVYLRLEKMPAVTIAEINGAALGGGFELALSCDLRVVCPKAKIGLPEARLGLLPGAGGTQRLTRLCGDGIARRLILGTEVVDGAEAVKLGIAQWLSPAEEIEEFTGQLVKRISALPKQAVIECKSCIDAALDDDQDGYEKEIDATYRLLSSDITQKKVREFFTD